MKTCDWCKELLPDRDLSHTRCGLLLCPLCYDDHDRQGCYNCALEEWFEAGDHLRDMERGT